MIDFTTPVSRATQWLGIVKGSAHHYYSLYFEPDQLFCFRPINLHADLPIIHHWVNQDYAKTFWQMEGSLEQLQNFYRQIELHPSACSFIGCINGSPVCQLDAYDPSSEEVGSKYHYRDGDLGIHLLLCPEKSNIKNLSAKIVSSFIRWVFKEGYILRVMAEPDHRNRPARWLLRRLCFDYLGDIELTEKKASMYCIDKVNASKMPEFQ